MSRTHDPLEICSVPIASLILDPSNARKHNPKNIDAIKASLTKFGQVEPLVINKRTGIVIGGNGRVEAMKALGWSEASVVHVDLDNTQAAALGVALNRTSELAEWDKDVLGSLLHGLQEDGLNLAEIGFDLDDLDGFKGVDFGNSGITEENQDDVPEVKESFVKRGEIWELGSHRLMCGDSTKKEDVERLMAGEKGCLCVTDPPYGIAYVSNAKSKGQGKSFDEIENDELDGEKLQQFLESAIRCAVPHLIDNCAFYLWHPMLTQGTFFAAAAAADILISRQIIWVKPSLVFGRGDYHWRHELCFYGWRRGNKPEFYGDRNQTTIWEIGRETDKIHPTQKPVQIYEIPINNHTKTGQVIYEPFGGSGSAFVAAEKTNRRCFGMEIDEHYCSVIIKRWQDLTGKEAKKVG